MPAARQGLAQQAVLLMQAGFLSLQALLVALQH